MNSQTNLNPAKTELRIKGQRMEIFQTLKDGIERLFYFDMNKQELQEDLGEPKKIANRFAIKKSEDEDNTILRRNEYIGDLDGTHLILQTNCNLQLLNRDQILWSFDRHFKPGRSCFLRLDSRNQVVVFMIDQGAWYTEKIMKSDGYYYQVEETLITFEDDQPMIIQTFKNGTELTFTSERGQNHGLKLKRKPRQLAEKTLNISKDFKMERMDYVGNLTGLHFILGQNCDLMLANGSQKLWELIPKVHRGLLLECSLQFDQYGDILLKRDYSSLTEVGYYVLTANYGDKKFLTGYQFTLEDNQLILTRQFINRPPNVYLAGPRTRGTLFQIITEDSLIISHNDKEERVLPKMGYIGDLNGVYAMFEEDCNWVLYNKTQVIWESGTSRNDNDRDCVLILKKNGSVEITHKWEHQRENYFWSTQNLTIDPENQILKTKLLVNNDGLWLTNTYTDETVKKFRALEGTNSFIHVPNEYHR